MENKPVNVLNRNVSVKFILRLILGFVAVGLIMYYVMSYTASCKQESEKRSKAYEAERQRILGSRESATHAREYWGKRYEDWEESVGYPAKTTGKRGELGLTPIYYPTLGITVIVNDYNQIIRVESE